MGRVISSMSMSLDGFIAAEGQAPHLAGTDGLDGSAGALVMTLDAYQQGPGRTGPGRTGRGGPLPYFVLTGEHPEPASERRNRTAGEVTFVADGVESAVRQARAAAGHGDVGLRGGAAAQQCLRAGLLDELRIRLVPTLLGSGVRLFDHLGTRRFGLERTKVVESPGVTQLMFRVVR